MNMNQNQPITVQDSLSIAAHIGRFGVFSTIVVTVALLIALNDSPDPFVRLLPWLALVVGILLTMAGFSQAITNERNQAHRRQNAAIGVDLDRQRLAAELDAEQRRAQIRIIEAREMAQIEIHKTQQLSLAAPKPQGLLVTDPNDPGRMLLNPSLSPNWTYRLADGRTARGDLIEALHDLRDEKGDMRAALRNKGFHFSNDSLTAAIDAWVEAEAMDREGSKFVWIAHRITCLTILTRMREGTLQPAPTEVEG